ncbi:MAG TPA: class I SAM-dependent methyltransferase [Nitrososphaerales archaeon]|nr:class I SAM-dependent methyltransferase [Nitrososphaerales archaeon]
MVSSTAPKRLGDWITDRKARRPSGAKSETYYRDPTHHRPNFPAILDILALRPSDRLLEIGCGGGAFLHEAMQSGCSASAIDHSPYMVRLASAANQASITDGRLSVRVGGVDSLPYGDGTYTCVVMTGVLGFLDKPLVAFKEVFRVLERGGRFVAYTGSKDLRGTPAAPEPVASRLNFYEDDEILKFAQLAGFGAARVEHPLLYEYAKKAGVPEPDLGLFRGTKGSQLLIARKL